MTEMVTPEQLARAFHEHYERLAPYCAYETRVESAVPWEEVPKNNRRLMTMVAATILMEFFPERMALEY